MNISGSHGFVNQLLLGAIIAIGFGGTVGLGTVWMRHQISVVADDNRALEQQYNEVQRRIADTNAMVEEAMSLDVLRKQNERMNLGLVEMTQGQIQDVQDDPIRQFVAHANRNAVAREGLSSGLGIRLNLDSNASPSPAPSEQPAAQSSVSAANPLPVRTTSATRGTQNSLRLAVTP